MEPLRSNISSNEAVLRARIQKFGRSFLEIRLDRLGVIRCRHNLDLQFCFSL